MGFLLYGAGASNTSGAGASKVFRAGAYAMDIAPTNFPVIVNGGFFEVTTDKAFDKLQARCLALVEGIDRAIQNLAPAQAGWAVVQDGDHTHTRRWIHRSDKIGVDPFGQRNVRANMHPGYQNPDAIGPSGPVDPGLSFLSIQTLAGRPLALLANYSMHYFGSPPLSADYYGRFAHKLKEKLASDGGAPEFLPGKGRPPLPGPANAGDFSAAGDPDRTLAGGGGRPRTHR